MNQEFRGAVAITADGMGKVELTGDNGERITVFVSHGGDYVAIDAFRDGKRVAVMDIDYADDGAPEI